MVIFDKIKSKLFVFFFRVEILQIIVDIIKVKVFENIGIVKIFVVVKFNEIVIIVFKFVLFDILIILLLIIGFFKRFCIVQLYNVKVFLIIIVIIIFGNLIKNIIGIQFCLDILKLNSFVLFNIIFIILEIGIFIVLQKREKIIIFIKRKNRKRLKLILYFIIIF